MDRANAVKLLPEAYVRALTLRDKGCDNDAIAAALETLRSESLRISWTAFSASSG